MTEASRVQKLLNEQNAEIDRLNFQIQVIQGAAAHAQKSYEQHLAVYRQKLEEKPPVWHDDIRSLQERDAIMTDRIEKLESENNDIGVHLDGAMARIETLKEALRPFAEWADAYEPDEGDEHELAWNHRATIKMLRVARDTLRGKDED